MIHLEQLARRRWPIVPEKTHPNDAREDGRQAGTFAKPPVWSDSAKLKFDFILDRIEARRRHGTELGHFPCLTNQIDLPGITK